MRRTNTSAAGSAGRAMNDPFAECNTYALTVRVLLEEGRSAEACAIEPPDVTDSIKGMRGKVLASRALALATLGRLSEHRSWTSSRGGNTRGGNTGAVASGKGGGSTQVP